MLNMDFNQRVIIESQSLEWAASPRPGVWRKPLAREEAERGHATSIVRYEPGASFSSHDHPLGEEILVKLHQFLDGDNNHVCIDTQSAQWLPGNGNLQVQSLHTFESEQVALVRWPAGEHFQRHRHPGGEEIYVISGELIDEFGRYPAGSWIRSPHMSEHQPSKMAPLEAGRSGVRAIF